MNLKSIQSPTLSIGLSVLNGEDYISQCINSILNQSFQDWELIIIDDGSTDNTLSLIKSFDDNRILIFSDNDNKGLASRLNEAIFLSHGKYFARIDQDDICHLDRFFYQIKYLEKHTNVDLLGCQCLTINENNIVVGALPIATTHINICSQPWKGFYIPHPSWVGKIEWFKKHLYADPAPLLCEDQELLLRTHASSNFYNLPLFLLAYRVRSKFKLRKSIPTRLALCRVQLRYFLHSKNYKFVAFVFVTTYIRIIKDIINWLKQLYKISRNDKDFPLLIDTDRTSWKRYLTNLKK